MLILMKLMNLRWQLAGLAMKMTSGSGDQLALAHFWISPDYYIPKFQLAQNQPDWEKRS
jgi:hypothetical protein